MGNSERKIDSNKKTAQARGGKQNNQPRELNKKVRL
jgi:hypothetical protein